VKRALLKLLLFAACIGGFIFSISLPLALNDDDHLIVIIHDWDRVAGKVLYDGTWNRLKEGPF
jgi:hypothetical protein